MSWTAPDAPRPAPPTVAGERAMLEAWLDYHRATLLRKCARLTAGQLAQRSAPPSTLSLLGLIRHMAEVERWWFRRGFGGEAIAALYCTSEEPDADLDCVDGLAAERDLAAYRAECDASRRSISGAGLDDTFRHELGGLESAEDVSLRWIFNHMIETYARHNGHADLLRQAIDGAIGV